MSTTTDGSETALYLMKGGGGSMLVHIAVLRARLTMVTLNGPAWITCLQLVGAAYEQRG